MNNRGAMLLEIIAASVITAIGVYAATAALGAFSKSSNRMRENRQRNLVVQSLIQRIRAKPSEFQAATNEAGSPSGIAEIENIKNDLPYAYFNEPEILPKDQCDSCPGRIGFVIQPLPGLRSMSIVRLFVKDTRIKTGDDLKEFTFIIPSK